MADQTHDTGMTGSNEHDAKETEATALALVETTDLNGSLQKEKTSKSTELACRNAPPPLDISCMPEYGPADPKAARTCLEHGVVGHAEVISMHDFEFYKHLRDFRNTCANAESRGENQRHAHHVEQQQDSKREQLGDARKRQNLDSKKTEPYAVAVKRKKQYGDPSVLDGPNAYKGPWGGDSSSDSDTARSDYDQEKESQEEEEEEKEDKVEETENAEVLARSSNRCSLIAPGSERSIFHGTEEYDYMGRTYMVPPPGTRTVVRNDDPGASVECFLPKKLLHTFRGHSMAVNVIKLFPKSAHLLLSASMDSKVKLWATHGSRRVLRTFLGHNKGVRDVTFDNTGARFLSASYDKYLKLWDTETGKCSGSFTTGKVPCCVRFNPDEENQHIFLTGQTDRKIYQFDVRTGGVVQEYEQHLGPVNTITFVDNNRRFVTTSDDKSLRAWEFDIPVVIKYIAEPHMHSMPAVTLSPRSEKWLACQSLDNQILLYNVLEGFRLNRRKSFKGHVVAGYACQVNYSPDERFLMSGDSTGSVYFWDFKTAKLLKKLKAHDNVVMGCEWHPHETSKVFTCSWDGTIKLWD